MCTIYFLLVASQLPYRIASALLNCLHRANTIRFCASVRQVMGQVTPTAEWCWWGCWSLSAGFAGAMRACKPQPVVVTEGGCAWWWKRLQKIQTSKMTKFQNRPLATEWAWCLKDLARLPSKEAVVWRCRRSASPKCWRFEARETQAKPPPPEEEDEWWWARSPKAKARPSSDALSRPARSIAPGSGRSTASRLADEEEGTKAAGAVLKSE